MNLKLDLRLGGYTHENKERGYQNVHDHLVVFASVSTSGHLKLTTDRSEPG